jgi:hypothetical protein
MKTLRCLVLVTSVLVLGLAATTGPAHAAVVTNTPTWPIPADAAAGPPPIFALLAASDTPPPADHIVDPVTAGAGCGAWYQQQNYGDRWAAGSTWWEYRCTNVDYVYYNPCTSGACDAYCPYCYERTQVWTDYFYWDGSDAVSYGQSYTDSGLIYGYQAYEDDFVPSTTSYWWDGPTARWYDVGSYPLSVSTQGSGSGQVNSIPVAVTCPQVCQASFDAGTVVTLTATPEPDSVFAGWSGDCSGTGACQVTIDQASSVTATFAQKAFQLTVTQAGSGSGGIMSTPPGVSCGAGCQASFDAGAVVILTATPEPGSVFAGWSGDCSGTGACQVTIDQARSVTATFAPNVPPIASFTVKCTGLTCTFDGTGSDDPDGSLASWSWAFGDGTSGTGQEATHTYGRPAFYPVTLTVTDSAGATGSASKTLNPISLSARGYKQNGVQKVDLSWNGMSVASFEISRIGTPVATVQATSYTDNGNNRGSATYTYRVCAAATLICSNNSTVIF